MTVLQFPSKRPSRIAVATTARAYRQSAELEATIAYGTPTTKAEAHAQLALVTELAELVADGNAAPEHVCRARAAYGSALAFLTA